MEYPLIEQPGVIYEDKRPGIEGNDLPDGVEAGSSRDLETG